MIILLLHDSYTFYRIYQRLIHIRSKLKIGQMCLTALAVCYQYITVIIMLIQDCTRVHRDIHSINFIKDEII